MKKVYIVSDTDGEILGALPDNQDETVHKFMFKYMNENGEGFISYPTIHVEGVEIYEPEREKSSTGTLDKQVS